MTGSRANRGKRGVRSGTSKCQAILTQLCRSSRIPERYHGKALVLLIFLASKFGVAKRGQTQTQDGLGQL
jgi:hypothetical protein